MSTASLQELPLDHAYAGLGGSYHARVSPQPLPGARLLHFNKEAAALIGLAAMVCRRRRDVA